MAPTKIAFFDTKSYDKQVFDDVNKDFGYTITYFETHLNEDTVPLAENFGAVCIFVNDQINEKVIRMLESNDVRLIALRCAGYNNIDIEALNKSHIKAVRVPEYSPFAVAEHTVGLMLCLNRRIHKAYIRIREHNFSISGLMGSDFNGKTAGIIGTGKIGKCVISILRGMGMNVLAYDIKQDDNFAKDHQVKYVDLSELLESSDVISLHCPLTPKTKYLINDTTVDQMKDGVMLVNTGRGALIKTSALVGGLKRGKIGAAALDVYEEESEYFFEDWSLQIISDELLARLLTFPNVIVTSHQGFFTREAMTNIAATTLDNITQFFEKNKAPNEVS
ncbi:MAG: 2-hydroxyacid dehydrogenase [Chitinivibrionales bacterium]|nr:2-hydroxyacid dehydrogenase [Chitinivibrionales bacterium]